MPSVLAEERLFLFLRNKIKRRVAVPTNKEERVSDVPMNESEQVTD